MSANSKKQAPKLHQISKYLSSLIFHLPFCVLCRWGFHFVPKSGYPEKHLEEKQEGDMSYALGLHACCKVSLPIGYSLFYFYYTWRFRYEMVNTFSLWNYFLQDTIPSKCASRISVYELLFGFTYNIMASTLK